MKFVEHFSEKMIDKARGECYSMFNQLNKSPKLRRRCEKMGYKIKERRKEMQMTQEELANKSGVSRVTISALENDTTRVTTTKTLLKIAWALETTVDQLFYEDAV